MRKYIQQLYDVQGKKPAKMYPGLNAAKGTLILLVIFTHALPDGMALYFNYFFHMPVFLSISGYLLKKSAFKNGLRNYLQKLSYRLIIPWIIASFIYLPFSLQGRAPDQLSITDLLYPFFHLWYVPAYVIAALLCYAVTAINIPAKLVLFVTACFTVGWYIFFRENHLPVAEQPLYWFGEKRFYAYLFFFFLGYSLRNEMIKFFPSPMWLIGIVIASFGLIVKFVYSEFADTITVFPYMLFNTCLVLFLLLYAAPQHWFQNNFILLINKQSLGIYLYHPIIIFIIYRIIADPEKKHVSNLFGLGVGAITVVSILAIVWLIQKCGFTNRYLLGIIPEKKPTTVSIRMAAVNLN